MSKVYPKPLCIVRSGPCVIAIVCGPTDVSFQISVYIKRDPIGLELYLIIFHKLRSLLNQLYF